MAFSRTVAHATASDATFSAAGAAAWDGTSAHSPAVSGATVGGIPYCPTATSETTSAQFTYTSTGLIASGSERYLSLPGTTSDYAQTPNAAPLQITGDIDIRCRVALTDWTPAAFSAFVTKDSGGGAQRGYGFITDQSGSGKLIFLWFTGGSPTVISSTVAPTVADGATIWVRATLDVNNGAAGNTVTFYTAPDSSTVPTSWTQLGAPVVTGGTTSIDSKTDPVQVGCSGNYAAAAGKFYRAQILSGIDGTTVFDADFTQVTPLATTFTESSSNAATVTISTTAAGITGNIPAFISGSLLSTTDVRNERVTTRFIDSGANTALNFQVNGATHAALSASTFSTVGIQGNTLTLIAAAPTVAAAQVGLGSTTQTTVGAAGGASALPATPTGYLKINVAGTSMVIPYYAQA